MKKILLIILMLILTSMSAFGESLDEGYLNLIFNKFSSMSESEKATSGTLLSSLIARDNGLELLYREALKKSDAMAQYGISESDLRNNIDTLKTWSVEDRKALVAAGIAGNKSAVDALNAKNASDDSTGGATGGTTGGATGGAVGGSTGGPAPVYNPFVVFEDELSPMGSIMEIAKSERGLITKAISLKPELISKSFADIENHWSKDYVLYLVRRSIISGKSEKSFDPEASITKAEMVTLVTKMMIDDLSKIPVYTGNIEDIVQGKWYDGHMQRAFILGLIEPDKNSLFNPMQNASREEVVEIVIKALDVLDIPVSDDMKIYKSDFKDLNEISFSRRESMTIAINLKFISGKGDGILDPQSEIKRSEIAVVMKKLYLYILENME